MCTALSLALFLLGTHLCLVAGLARALGGEVPMSCMTSVAAARPAAAAHACCSGGAARGHASSRRPVAPAESPCCVLLVTAAAPSLDTDVAHAPCLSVAAPLAPMPAPAPSLVEVFAVDEHAPPGASLRAPLPARAPPVLA